MSKKFSTFSLLSSFYFVILLRQGKKKVGNYKAIKKNRKMISEKDLQNYKRELIRKYNTKQRKNQSQAVLQDMKRYHQKKNNPCFWEMMKGQPFEIMPATEKQRAGDCNDTAFIDIHKPKKNKK